MKNLVFPNGEVIQLTNKEFDEAKPLFIQEKPYFCPRLNDFVSNRFWYTKNRKYSDRFSNYFILDDQMLPTSAVQLLHDKLGGKMYPMPIGMTYEEAVQNLIDRENGKDAPLLLIHNSDSREKIDKRLSPDNPKRLITEDEFLEAKMRFKIEVEELPLT